MGRRCTNEWSGAGEGPLETDLSRRGGSDAPYKVMALLSEAFRAEDAKHKAAENASKRLLESHLRGALLRAERDLPAFDVEALE